jgi:hypothetical protein
MIANQRPSTKPGQLQSNPVKTFDFTRPRQANIQRLQNSELTLRRAAQRACCTASRAERTARLRARATEPFIRFCREIISAAGRYGSRSNWAGNTRQGPATFADRASPIFDLPSLAYSKNRRHVPSEACTIVASLGLAKKLLQGLVISPSAAPCLGLGRKQCPVTVVMR